MDHSSQQQHSPTCDGPDPDFGSGLQTSRWSLPWRGNSQQGEDGASRLRWDVVGDGAPETVASEWRWTVAHRVSRGVEECKAPNGAKENRQHSRDRSFRMDLCRPLRGLAGIHCNLTADGRGLPSDRPSRGLRSTGKSRKSSKGKRQAGANFDGLPCVTR